jgi:hypothetical protein
VREVERVRDTEVVGEPVFVIIVRVSVTVNVSVVEGVRVDPEFDPVNEANEYVLERVFV